MDGNNYLTDKFLRRFGSVKKLGTTALRAGLPVIPTNSGFSGE